MSLVKFKKAALQAAPAVAVTPAQKALLLSDFADQIDEVGRLQEKLAPVAQEIKALTAKLKPLKDAEANLQAKLDAMQVGADELYTEHGAEFDAQIGPKGNAREIKDIKKVHELLGDDLFYALAVVKLADIDRYLTLPQRDEVLKTERTKRSLKVKRRA